MAKWLEENPVIEVPSENDGELDTDWILSEEEEEKLLSTYLNKDQN